MKQSPSGEASSESATQEILRLFYGTGRFITVFTRIHHWSLSSARCSQFTTSLSVFL